MESKLSKTTTEPLTAEGILDIWTGKWVKKGFLAEKEINSKNGPLIEVGGPTDSGYKLVDIDISQLNKKIFVSNIYPGRPLFDRTKETAQILKYTAPVDFVADAQNLPFRNDSISVLFASHLPIEDIIDETKRVLEDGGLFIWQGVSITMIERAEKAGFELMARSREPIHLDEMAPGYPFYETWSVILKKTAN